MRSLAQARRLAPRRGGPAGSVFILSLMSMLVLTVLGMGVLSLSSTEDLNARRERAAVLAFFAAEGGVHEAVARMNLNPTGAADDETEVKAGNGAGPDSVRDPRMVQGAVPEANPDNFSDSTANVWRFWNYDPAWRYSGTSAGGEGNYPGASAAQAANLDAAGRTFTYQSASARSLPPGSGYAVHVVPVVRNFAGVWKFADERGNPAPNQYFYYKLSGAGTHGAQTATALVMTRKFFFGVNVPGALTAGGAVQIGGNASVTLGDPGDTNPTGVAVQSAGAVNVSGSGTLTGAEIENAAFPGFQSIFGTTPADVKAMATVTATYTSSQTTLGSSEAPSGTVGQVLWLTAKDGSLKRDITMNSGFRLGSPSEPVILVVDGNLTLNSVTIYGVIYVTGAFRNQGGSQVKGAILVEGTAETDILGTGSGDGTKIAYSAQVLRNVNRNQNMFPFRIVQGSWRMRRG
jgi:Tfp pilus assembly protein PilX